MIAKCGAAPAEFELDLELGRVLDKSQFQVIPGELSWQARSGCGHGPGVAR